jgi:hypothetical protein
MKQVPAAEKLCRAVIDKSTNHEIQARASFGLAQLFKGKSESIDTPPAEAENLSREAENLFAKLVAKFGDVKDLAEQAKLSLDEVRRFGIGKEAPDISGEDGDGKKFKLSDYRGKVVVLDFWAGW